MGSIENTVYYCSVSKGNGVLYSYNAGDPEIENLAALCLENTPSYHRWYFQTMAKKTFGFLMEDGYIYFAIVNETIPKPSILNFLQKLRDGFRKVVRKDGAGKKGTSLNAISLQEKLLPIIHHLIGTIDALSYPGEPSPSPGDSSNGQNGNGASTKAPLLGKPSRQDKKKVKDHVITMREIELEEHRRSTDRGGKSESEPLEVSPSSGKKDVGSTRNKSSSQALKKKWWRQVRIALAIDAVVCVVLFVIWLFICHGTECIH